MAFVLKATDKLRGRGHSRYTNDGPVPHRWHQTPSPTTKPGMNERLEKKKAYEQYLLEMDVTEMTFEELNDHLKLMPDKKIKKRCYCGAYFVPETLCHRLCPECHTTYKHYTTEMADSEPLEMKAEDIPVNANL